MQDDQEHQYILFKRWARRPATEPVPQPKIDGSGSLQLIEDALFLAWQEGYRVGRESVQSAPSGEPTA